MKETKPNDVQTRRSLRTKMPNRKYTADYDCSVSEGVESKDNIKNNFTTTHESQTKRRCVINNTICIGHETKCEDCGNHYCYQHITHFEHIQN